MGLFDDDFSVASEMFAEAFGSTVTISRGPLATEGVECEAYTNDYRVEETDGLSSIVSVRDYIFPLASYLIGGSAVAPQRGDRIKETIGGVEYTFEAAPVADMPVAQWADTDGGQWLVHTVRVSP